MKIIKVDWLDTCTEDSWSNKDEVSSLTCTQCSTVGYLFEKTKKHIKLVSTDTDIGVHMQIICIPKGCITKITTLKEE